MLAHAQADDRKQSEPFSIVAPWFGFMTLVAALHGPDWIVMAADRLHIVSNEVGRSNAFSSRKLRRVGKCGLGFAGREPVITLVDQIEREFTNRGSADVDEVARGIAEIQESYSKLSNSKRKITLDLHDARLLLTGFRGTTPIMYTYSRLTLDPPSPQESFAAIGIAGHAQAIAEKVFEWIAELDLASAKRLVAFLVHESGRCDRDIGKGIDVAVVTRDGFEPVTEEERESLNAAASRTSDAMLTALRKAVFPTRNWIKFW